MLLYWVVKNVPAVLGTYLEKINFEIKLAYVLLILHINWKRVFLFIYLL